MAYPTVSGPYGLIPINLIGGQVFASATRQIPIATNSSTAIYFGDVVKLNSSGTLDKDVGTSSATPVGVFLGCSYTDPTFGKTFRQYYAATTNITDIVAFVQDDPDALFKVAVVSTGTTISYVTRANVGENAVLVQTAGSTITGDSKVAISSTTGTTSTFPIRIIDVIAETSPAGFPASFSEVVVKWNQGMHPYLNPTGV
jgi:methylglyoxal synthase